MSNLAEQNKTTNQKEENDSQKLEQNQREKPISFIGNVALIGFFGGLIWSTFGLFLFYFNFSEFSPKVILSTWTTENVRQGWTGALISILLLSVLSIIVALVYYLTLRKVNGIFAGILFGLALWAIVMFALNPIFSEIKPFKELDRNTIITTACLYILYGVFVGYSISYEESERKEQNQTNKQEEGNQNAEAQS